MPGDGHGSMRSGMWFLVSIPKEDTEKAARSCADSRATLSEDDDRENFRDSKEHLTLKQALEDCLESYGIRNAIWNATAQDKFYQVSFPYESGKPTDCILSDLTSRGIGSNYDSTIGVFPCPIFYRAVEPESDDEEQNTIADVNYESGDEAKKEKEKESGFRSMQKKFLKSVKARLTVAQVVAGVKAQGELTFDFVAFIILAGMIAALGLMDNNVVSIIAAMLVSPLMGPIMAITFGIIIRDTALTKLGLKTELIGLFICLLFGFFFGLLNAFWGDIPPYEGSSWSPSRWPNPEMSSRGHWRSLWVGSLVALPSGGGVAMAILGGNSACLVGVAISASLLPPIINSGILWSLSLVKVFKSMTQDPIEVNVTGTTLTVSPAFIAPLGYSPYYFDKYNMHKECALLGVISFCLTVVNILCIILAGTLVLKIKEIAPSKSLQGTRRFWKHDIKVARDYNKTLGGAAASNMGKLLEEWRKLDGKNGDPASASRNLQDLQNMIEEAEDDDVYQTVVQQLANHPPPMNMVRYLSRALSTPEQKEHPGGGRMSVWELESLLGREPSSSQTKPRVTFKLRRSKSETMEADSSPSRGKQPGRKRPGFFPFRRVSRFQVSRVPSDEGSARQEPLLRKMRKLYRSAESPS
ncbi:uncharacterized protein [Dermacentor andersoni]|uniref:uncharacterized protein isoform X1 n=1 Tax=Dermacentor andersoni TaxID=34620 RepID=UPI00215579F9|nr:uncharacterized protein LOC126527133 isoform X1 [Dermacentor andersoni]